MSKLIKPVFGILFILALSFNGYTQMRVQRMPPQGIPVRRGMPLNRVNRPNPNRRIELVKEGFISRQLRLTPEESRAFWPLYRQYVQEQTAVRILKRINNSNTSTDGTGQIDRELDYESQLVEIKRHYRDEFLKILPPQKVSELYKSELQFNDEVVRQLSERNGMRPR
jgi:hypothetical protein